MTDNEIIKALEEIVGMRTLAKKSPKVDTELLISILDLINRQKAEIERLNNEIEEINNTERENELQAIEENKENAKMFLQAIEHAKSEAIKKFAERLNHKIVNTSSVFTVQKATHEFLSGNAHRQQEILDYIDELEKEMAETKN